MSNSPTDLQPIMAIFLCLGGIFTSYNTLLYTINRTCPWKPTAVMSYLLSVYKKRQTHFPKINNETQTQHHRALQAASLLLRSPRGVWWIRVNQSHQLQNTKYGINKKLFHDLIVDGYSRRFDVGLYLEKAVLEIVFVEEKLSALLHNYGHWLTLTRDVSSQYLPTVALQSPAVRQCAYHSLPPAKHSLPCTPRTMVRVEGGWDSVHYHPHNTNFPLPHGQRLVCFGDAWCSSTRTTLTFHYPTKVSFFLAAMHNVLSSLLAAPPYRGEGV